MSEHPTRPAAADSGPFPAEPVETAMPQEHTATADTPPEADIRHTRPVDDPDSLGASDFYPGSEGPDHSAAEGRDDRPPPVQVTDNPA